MKIVKTRHSDKNPGHYSPGVIHKGILYVSGQLSINPETGRIPEGGIAEQTRQALENMKEVLDSAGTTKDNVIKVSIYIADVEFWPEVNKVYSEFFESHKPARIVVPVKKLNYGCLVEIEALAAVD